MFDMEKIGYGNGLIYIGIPRERMYLNQFVDNRDALMTRLAESGRSCGFYQSEGHRVDRNRDIIVEAFLNQPKKPEWLLMLDTDMEHPLDAPIRLANWKKPIVGALYFHRGQSHDPFIFDYIGTRKDQFNRDMHTWHPRRDEVYQFLEENGVPMRDGGLTIDHCTRNPLTECDAVGTGCMIIHRSVFETMPAPWFEYRVGGNSEDLIFCKEAKEIYNIPVFCDQSTICGHFNWVAMGQAQFRMNFLNRGVNLTSYTKSVAARWWADFFKIEYEEAVSLIEKGSAAMLAPAWKAHFPNGKEPLPEQVMEFYQDPEVGKNYLMELLHWNFEGNFKTLQKALVTLRNANVLEVGAGIGTIALQLWIQGNNVLASEVNPILRDFMDYRYNLMSDATNGVTGKVGQLSIIDNSWIEKTPDESLDFVISFETFEHLQEQELARTIEAIWTKLKKGGRLIYTANFKQQEIYPMHFKHEKSFERLISCFERLSDMELKKV